MSPPLYVTLLPACFSHLEIKLLDPTRPEIPVKSHYIMQLFYPFYCFMNNIHNVCSSIREIREHSVLITSQVRSCCDICDEPSFISASWLLAETKWFLKDSFHCHIWPQVASTFTLITAINGDYVMAAIFILGSISLTLQSTTHSECYIIHYIKKAIYIQFGLDSEMWSVQTYCASLNVWMVCLQLGLKK